MRMKKIDFDEIGITHSAMCFLLNASLSTPLHTALYYTALSNRARQTHHMPSHRAQYNASLPLTTATRCTGLVCALLLFSVPETSEISRSRKFSLPLVNRRPVGMANNESPADVHTSHTGD